MYAGYGANKLAALTYATQNDWVKALFAAVGIATTAVCHAFRKGCARKLTADG